MKPGDLGQSTVLFAIEEAIEEAIDGVPVRRYASDDEAHVETKPPRGLSGPLGRWRQRERTTRDTQVTRDRQDRGTQTQEVCLSKRRTPPRERP